MQLTQLKPHSCCPLRVEKGHANGPQGPTDAGAQRIRPLDSSVRWRVGYGLEGGTALECRPQCNSVPSPSSCPTALRSEQKPLAEPALPRPYEKGTGSGMALELSSVDVIGCESGGCVVAFASTPVRPRRLLISADIGEVLRSP
jgi:hypothetical protein